MAKTMKAAKKTRIAKKVAEKTIAKKTASKKAVAKKVARKAVKPPKTELPVLPFATRKAWADWLKSNHDSSPGLWFKFAKKSTGIPSIYYADALEEALCYGWIDGQTASFDDR